MERTYWIYILASRTLGALYLGVIFRLVLAEPYPDVRSAIARKKQLKKWRRAWKIDLTERTNPDWKDFYDRFNT